MAALREHLIDRILITAYPEEHQRAHATYWLAWIAPHLSPDRDIAWWRIPTWIPPWQLRLTTGLGGGLGGGLGREPQAIFPRWPRPRELLELLSFGLVVGLVVGLAFGSMQVSLTELILATTGVGQVKFIPMLEDALHRQVLRQAGAVYQFRHAELQDHLAKIHHSHSQPPTST